MSIVHHSKVLRAVPYFASLSYVKITTNTQLNSKSVPSIFNIIPPQCHFQVFVNWERNKEIIFTIENTNFFQKSVHIFQNRFFSRCEETIGSIEDIIFPERQAALSTSRSRAANVTPDAMLSPDPPSTLPESIFGKHSQMKYFTHVAFDSQNSKSHSNHLN